MASNGTATAKIQMLDDTTHTYDVKVNSYGVVLLQSVMKDLNVLEADYFGILFKDKQGIESFLDPLKKIKTQIQNINSNVLKFVVRFFPPDPGQLQEEYTRYLFALQVKRDIAEGLLPCNENTLAIMTAYIAQSSFGDWNYTACYNLTYLRDMKLLPLKPELNQEEMLSKIAGQHKLWSGQTSADADYHLLDVVRKLELYGIRLHPAHDQEKTEISLAVAHAGVMVFRGYAKINTFNWARIRKLSFKKKRFLIKLKTDANLNNPGRNVGDVLIFIMTSRDACKSFWRHCIEYHAFFRLEIRPNPKPKPLLLSRGSTFRYSGKTQKQLSELVRTSNFRRTMFVRASSRKPAAHSPRTSSWTPNAARKVPPPTLPSSVANGFKAEAVVENHDGITLSPIRSEVESNGQLANRYAHSSITSEEAQKNTLESRNGRPSSNTSDSWQVKSENLHSNVVVSRGMAEHQSDYEKAGNAGDVPMHAGSSNNNNSLATAGGRPMLSNPDILDGVDNALSRFSNERSDAIRYDTNDNREMREPAAAYLSKNILSIESVSSSSKSSRSSRSSVNRSSSSTSSRRSKSTLPLPPPPPPPQTDSEEDEVDLARDPQPPPLPPKMSSPLSPSTPFTSKVANQVCTNSASKSPNQLQDISSVSTLTNVTELPSSLQYSIGLSESEISIPSLIAGEPRTPSHYATLEQKMIKAGFYSVPTKPPIPPQGTANEPESVIERARNELDIAARDLHCDESDDEQKRSDKTSDSHDGQFGVVIDSDEDGDDSEDESSKDLTFDFDKNLLTPIPMNFNDQYRGPDYGSADALSSFAVELEASFDRIQQSHSREKLNVRRDNIPIKAPPKTSGTRVLSAKDDSSFRNINHLSSDGNSLNQSSRIAANANNNNVGFSTGRILTERHARRENHDTVLL